MKCLVTGWFSFEQMGATAGDLIARDLLCERLYKAAIPYKVAVAPPFSNGVDWRTENPDEYTDVIFVCGPFGNGWPVTELMERFSGKRFHGLNLSMLQPLEEWNPFQQLLERDSDRKTHPDITFLGKENKVPVAGVILVHPQKEYGKRAMHHQVHASIEDMIAKKQLAAVRIDTSLIDNQNGFSTPEEVESLIAKMDLVITTRLHGTVLALKNGVPVIPIDPISGGAKISSQVRRIGWPLLFSADSLDQTTLSGAYDFCLTDEARFLAKKCGQENRQVAGEMLEQFVKGIRSAPDHAMIQNMFQ